MTKTHTLIFDSKDRHNFDALNSGKKSIETRAGSEMYHQIQPDDNIVFVCDKESIYKKVKEVYKFNNLDDLLETISLTDIMPWVKSRSEAREIWLSFPGYKQRIEQYGIIAFKV